MIGSKDLPGEILTRLVGCRHVFLAGFMLVTCLCSKASAFDLVSQDEAATESRTPHVSAKSWAFSPTPNAPNIKIVSPQLGGPLHTPVDILLNWESAEGSKVDPASLRVSYGRLRLDITDRLRKYATVTATGLEAKNARLPAGTHRLLITIADTQSREGSREIVLEVSDN